MTVGRVGNREVIVVGATESQTRPPDELDEGLEGRPAEPSAEDEEISRTLAQ